TYYINSDNSPVAAGRGEARHAAEPGAGRRGAALPHRDEDEFAAGPVGGVEDLGDRETRGLQRGGHLALTAEPQGGFGVQHRTVRFEHDRAAEADQVAADVGQLVPGLDPADAGDFHPPVRVLRRPLPPRFAPWVA